MFVLLCDSADHTPKILLHARVIAGVGIPLDQPLTSCSVNLAFEVSLLFSNSQTLTSPGESLTGETNLATACDHYIAS